MPFLIGLIALILLNVALRAYVRAPPALLAGLLKRGGGFLALIAAALLLARARIDLALSLGVLGFWLLGGFGRTMAGFRAAGGAARGKVSRVRSAMIEMELHHETGAVRGVVLAGVDEGKQLNSLARPKLMELYGLCRVDDPDGARLLEMYLDRRFPGWRQASQGQHDAGNGGAGAGPNRRAGTISEDEAYEILGLRKGAPLSDISRAHRELMKKFHPDHGGTTDLAARVNEAKEVLMRRHH